MTWGSDSAAGSLGRQGNSGPECSPWALLPKDILLVYSDYACDRHVIELSENTEKN